MKFMRGLGRCVRSLRRVIPSGIVFVLMELLDGRKLVAIEGILGSVVNWCLLPRHGAVAFAL
jgi:hypothetical protein